MFTFVPMPGNAFGQLLRITTFGESHGPGLGVVIDGFPADFPVDFDAIANEMARRKPGQSKIVTQRKEGDEIEFVSGVFEGRTTGTPIMMLIRNADQRSQDYSHIKDKFRPSHADYTYHAKYGHRDYRGGGRSSARETAARVAAGALAKQWLGSQAIHVHAWVSQVGEILLEADHTEVDLAEIETNEVRCPDPKVAAQMIELIREVRKAGDTIGGAITGLVTGLPPGLGEPVFDKLHADLAKAIMSINASRGFEIGSGFGAMKMRGSAHNDHFEKVDGKVRTKTNHSGGIQGGISNGMEVYFRAAFKPVATIVQEQQSINEEGESVRITGKGRHDPCVLPRAVPIVEAMTALVIADHLLRHRAYTGSTNK